MLLNSSRLLASKVIKPTFVAPLLTQRLFNNTNYLTTRTLLHSRSFSANTEKSSEDVKITEAATVAKVVEEPIPSEHEEKEKQEEQEEGFSSKIWSSMRIITILVFGGYGVTTLYELLQWPEVCQEIVDKAVSTEMMAYYVGNPVTISWLWHGTITEHDLAVRIPVSGPKGDAEIYCRAFKTGETWHFSTIQARFGEQKAFVSLNPLTGDGMSIIPREQQQLEQQQRELKKAHEKAAQEKEESK